MEVTEAPILSFTDEECQTIHKAIMLFWDTKNMLDKYVIDGKTEIVLDGYVFPIQKFTDLYYALAELE